MLDAFRVQNGLGISDLNCVNILWNVRWCVTYFLVVQ